MTTIYTQDMLDAVKKAYASGTLELTYEGKQIRYRSLDEMDRIIAKMTSELAADAGTVKSKQIRMNTRTGL